MKIMKDLRGGSLSKTSIVCNGETKTVRKMISIEDNREYGLVRWHSQLRKLQTLREILPQNTLEICSAGVQDGFYYFDIPYVENGCNLFEALIQGVSHELLADQLSEIVSCLASHLMASVPGSFSVYLYEEVLRPLRIAQEKIEQSERFLSIQERSYLLERISFILPLVEEKINFFRSVELPECMTHGNLTLENAIWDFSCNKIFLIDFYGETYCESILGDVSQIYQSSKSGYEAISTTNLDFSIINYPYDRIPNELTKFSEYFHESLKHEDWYDAMALRLFHASQFTRMFPFKIISSPRFAFLFLNHGMDLLENE